MSLRFGSVTVTVASSPTTAQEILQKNDQSFTNRPIPESVAAQPNVNDTLAWSHADSRWRNRRRICTTQIFTSHRLDLLQHLRHRKVEQLVQHLHKKAAERSTVDIGELAFATMLNLVSNTVFSEDLVDSEFESAGEFKELVWRIMEDAGKVNVSDYFPVVKRFDLQGVKRHVKVSYVRLHEIFDRMIQKRVEDRKSNSRDGGVVAGDFLDVLLDHCQQEEGSAFSVESIKPLILVIKSNNFVFSYTFFNKFIFWRINKLINVNYINFNFILNKKNETCNVLCKDRLTIEEPLIRNKYFAVTFKLLQSEM
jgi:cytochrome P450